MPLLLLASLPIMYYTCDMLTPLPLPTSEDLDLYKREVVAKRTRTIRAVFGENHLAGKEERTKGIQRVWRTERIVDVQCDLSDGGVVIGNLG